MVTALKVSVLNESGRPVATIPEEFALELTEFGYRIQHNRGKSYLIPPKYQEEQIA